MQELKNKTLEKDSQIVFSTTVLSVYLVPAFNSLNLHSSVFHLALFANAMPALNCALNEFVLHLWHPLLSHSGN